MGPPKWDLTAKGPPICPSVVGGGSGEGAQPHTRGLGMCYKYKVMPPLTRYPFGGMVSAFKNGIV